MVSLIYFAGFYIVFANSGKSENTQEKKWRGKGESIWANQTEKNRKHSAICNRPHFLFFQYYLTYVIII